MVPLTMMFTLFSALKKRWVLRIDFPPNRCFLEDKSKVARKQEIQKKKLRWILYADVYRKDYVKKKSHNEMNTNYIHRISS